MALKFVRKNYLRSLEFPLKHAMFKLFCTYVSSIGYLALSFFDFITAKDFIGNEGVNLSQLCWKSFVAFVARIKFEAVVL